jgi:HK97 family phage major capsid protein
MSDKTKTIKVPENLTRSGIMEVDPETKSAKVSISSDTPYERYDWWNDERYYEVLDHSPTGVSDGRLKSGLPMLFNHDRNFHLGRASAYENDGHRLIVSDLKWSEDEKAMKKKKDMDSGVLVDTSVGYRLIGDGECIGAKDGIPVYKFKWEPHEFSLVTIPADFSVGVGRERGEKPKDEPREIRVRGAQFDKKPKTEDNRAMSDTNTSGIDVKEVESKAVVNERKRVSDIQELAKHFRENGLAGRKIETSELAAKFIAEGKTDREFQDAVVRGNFPDVKPVATTAPELGMNDKEKRQFSIVRAIGLLARKQPLDGIEKEASEAHAKLIGKEVEGMGFFLPQDIMRGAAFPGGISEDQLRTMPTHVRALFANVFSGAGAFVGNDLLAGSMIELLRNQMAIVRMGARSLSGLKGNVSIPRQTGGATASWLAEDSTITASQQTVGQLNLTPHKLAAATAYTQQLLIQGSVDVENFVRQDLMAVIAIERDRAAIAGSGVSGEPQGILNTGSLSTSVTLSAAQSMTYANAVQFETNVSLNNAILGKLGYITTPTVKGNAKLVAEISAANSVPVWKNDMVNGYPAFATNQVPTATSVIFGNFDDLILADWADTSVLVDPYSLSLQGQIRVIMQMYCDNGIRHTKSFSVSTN